MIASSNLIFSAVESTRKENSVQLLTRILTAYLHCSNTVNKQVTKEERKCCNINMG